MRKCIDMGEGREIIINDKDMLKPDGILEIPDIGLGEAYLGKASYVDDEFPFYCRGRNQLQCQ